MDMRCCLRPLLLLAWDVLCDFEPRTCMLFPDREVWESYECRFNCGLVSLGLYHRLQLLILGLELSNTLLQGLDVDAQRPDVLARVLLVACAGSSCCRILCCLRG